MAQEYSKISDSSEGVAEDVESRSRSGFEETVGKAKEKVRKFGESASQYYKQGLESARGWEKKVETFVKDKPITSILIAAGVGMLFGFIWKRR